MARQLSKQRCFNHANREAVARCPECRKFFCRECITEYDHRMICASCLTRLTGDEEESRPRFTSIVRASQFTLAIVILWLFFYISGQWLLSLPATFHDSAVWHTDNRKP